MRPGICMECGKEFDRVNERHNAVDCLNGLKKERDKLHTALESLADTVDDSLLLDEALAEDWDKLRNAVVEARKALKKG